MSIVISTLLPLFVGPFAPETAAPVALSQPVRQAVLSPPSPTATLSGPVGGDLILAQSPAPPPAAAPAPPATATFDRDAVIDRAGKALAGVKTAQGRFTQLDPYGEESAGDFYISRPGKIRFDYRTPEPMHIVSDGVSVSIEEPKRDAYDAVPLASTSFSLFLKDSVNLQRAAKVRDVKATGGSYFVTLEDKTGEAEGQMTLEFRASDFELLGWRATDGSGGETKVQLSDVKTNVALKPALFVVRDPNDDDDHR